MENSTLKVGYIKYLNSFPFWYDANKEKIEGVECESHTPAELNSKLNEGKLSLSAVSAFEYLSHHEKYLLLPELCINSQGQVRSVSLFSKKTIEELNKSVVCVTSESATSVNLLKIILANKGISPDSFVTMSNHSESNNGDAVLLIGDRALKFKSDEHKYVYDLADEWNKLTGLPVVFALWVLRKDHCSKHDVIHKVHKQLLNTRYKLQNNPDSYVQKIESSFSDVPSDMKGYFEKLDFHFHKKCEASLLLYAKKCESLNLLPSLPQLEFFNYAPD